MKSLIAFLAVFDALALAYLFSDHHDINSYPRYAPNFMHRAQVPTRPDGPGSECGNAQVKAVADKLNKELPLKTKSSSRGPVML